MSNNKETLRASASIQLFRALHLYTAITVSVHVFTAIGLFALLQPLINTAGISAPLSFLLIALLFLPTILAYGEIAARTPGPGGSYRLVETTLPEIGVFLTGWAALLGQLSAGALLALTCSSLISAILQRVIPIFALPTWLIATLVIASITVINFRGERISLRFQSYLVTAICVLLLILAVVSGGRNPPQLDAAIPLPTTDNWFVGLGILLTCLWSVEVIVGVRDEMRRPHYTLPRVLVSATVLSALLSTAITLSAAQWLKSSNPQLPTITIALWAQDVFAAWAWWAAIGAGIVFCTIALNRVVLTIDRQMHTLSQEGYLPSLLSYIPPQRRTPVITVSTVGGAVLILTLWGDIFALARLSGICLLITGSLVNLATALGRHADSKPGPFALPLHPFIPIFGIAANIFMLLAFSTSALLRGGTWMLIGVGLYFIFVRRWQRLRQEGTTVFREENYAEPIGRYRVLVLVKDSGEALASINLAATLASRQDGEVIVLQVVEVPDQVNVETGRRWAQRRLEALAQLANQVQIVPVIPMIRLARDVPRAIIGAAREEECDLIVMNWRGPTISNQSGLEPVLRSVLNEAPCNVIVVKGRELDTIRRVLIPTAGGPHAPLAAKIGLAMVQETGGVVTLLNVIPSDRADKTALKMAHLKVTQTASDLGDIAAVSTRVEEAPDVVTGILTIAEENDLIMLGATEESILDQVLFGRLPEQIAARTRKPVAIVKRYRGLPQTWARKVWQSIYNIVPNLDRNEQAELITSLRRGARANYNYYMLIFLSAFIATMGLLQNSAAVIIGAMLVAPLMTPILSLSLGIVLGDVRTLRVAAESVIRGVLTAVSIAILLTLISPAVAVTPEIAARAQPTLLDLFVALASGAAGAYALGRKEVAAALPGVAIAAALMPPVCAIGIGIALGNPVTAGGATLLFTTNLVAISVAGCLIFLLLGIRPKIYQRERRVLLQRGLLLSLILLIIVAVPLGLLLSRSVQKVKHNWTLEITLRRELGGAQVMQVENRTERGTLYVTATAYAVRSFSQDEVRALQRKLEETLGKPVMLSLTIIEVAEYKVP